MSDEIEKNIKKGKILPRVIGALAIIVILCIVVLVILSLLSPKNRYFSLVNNILADVSYGIGKFEKTPIGNFMDVDTNSKVNVDVLLKGELNTDNYDFKESLKNLNSFEMRLKEDIDLVNEYSYLDTKFLVNGEDLLSGKLVKNSNMISLNIPSLTDGYITADNNNLSDFWNKIGYNGPSKLTTYIDWIKMLKLSDDEKKTLRNALEKSFSAFLCNFDDEDFFEGIGEVKYDEGVIECNYIDFNMSAKKLNSGIISILEELRSKDEYIDLIYKGDIILNELYGKAPFTKSEFLLVYEEFLEMVRNVNFSDAEGIVIRLYYKEKDVIKIEILGSDYNNKYFEFTMIENQNSSYYMYKNDVRIYEDKVTIIDDIITHVLNIDYIDSETGNILEGHGNEIVITIDNSSKNSQVVNLVEKKRVLDYSAGESDVMSIEPSVIRDYKLVAEILDDVNKLSITTKDNNNELLNTFNVTMNVKENAEFERVEVKDDFDITKKNDDEIEKKKNELDSKWNKFTKGNSKKIEQFQVAMSLYFNMFSNLDYSDNFIE